MTVFKSKKLPSQLSTSRYTGFDPQSRQASARKMSDLSMWDNNPTSSRAEPEKSKFSLVSILISASALLVLGFTCYFLVDKFMVQSPTKIPLISAPKGPYKIRPQDPGGITFPHQDKFVYGKLSRNKAKVRERVLPKAEQPVAIAKPSNQKPLETVDAGSEGLVTPAQPEQQLVAEKVPGVATRIEETVSIPPQPAPRSNIPAVQPAKAADTRAEIVVEEVQTRPVTRELAANGGVNNGEVSSVRRKPVVRQPVSNKAEVKAAAVLPPEKASDGNFDADFARLVAGRDNPSRSASMVIPDQIPTDSPLHATAPAVKAKPKTRAKPVVARAYYRLQLATLPSLPAAQQERDLLISASGLSSAKFEVQGFTNSGGQIVYRIFYGKYKSEKKVQKARKLLIRKGLHPIILRME